MIIALSIIAVIVLIVVCAALRMSGRCSEEERIAQDFVRSIELEFSKGSN